MQRRYGLFVVMGFALAGCAGVGQFAALPPSAERPGTRVTLRNPDTTKWSPVPQTGPRTPETATTWTCRPMACAGRAVLAAHAGRSPTRHPDAKALETAAKLLPAQARAQDIMLEAVSDGEERITPLSSRVTEARGYPAILAELKRMSGKKTSYLVRGELFIGMVRVRVISSSTDRAEAKRNFDSFVQAMEILDFETPTADASAAVALAPSSPSTSFEPPPPVDGAR